MSGIYIPALKPEEWSRFLAEPKHWKKGYSAMSLAMCWQEADGFPDSVTAVFNQSDFKQLHDINLFFFFICCKTQSWEVPIVFGKSRAAYTSA